MMLSAQASAFDVGGFKYDVIGATSNVELGGCVPAPCAVTDIVIPATASDGTTTYSVTSIGKEAFAFNALTSVTIPDSVTSIGAGAFVFNDLTSVTIPDSVTTLGAGAFRDNALTSVTIGDSVTSIGNTAFADNALTSVTIPDSVTSIEDYAFRNNALTSVAFLGNFGTFELDMFEVNDNLATITYAQGATGWDSPPRTFTPSTGPTGSVTAEAAAAPPAPAATPVPTSPIWLLVMMAGLLSLVAVKKLRKA